MAVLLGTACESPAIRADVARLQTELEGDAGLAGSGGLPPRSHELDSELGFDGDEPSLLAQVEIVDDAVRGRFAGFRHEQEGDTVLARPFGDFAAGSPVATDFDFFTIDGSLSYEVLDVPLGDVGAVRLSPGVAVQWFDVDLDVVGAGIAGSESVRTDAVVPMPFVLGEVELGPARLQVDGSGMEGDFGGGDATYWDVGGSLGVRVWERVELFGGYRLVSIDADDAADGRAYSWDVELHGWFVGAGMRF